MEDNTEEGLPILKKKTTTEQTEDGLPVLKKKVQEPTQLESPSDIGTSPSMDGASAPQGLPTINSDLNAGSLQPTAPTKEPQITIEPQGLSAATTTSYETTKEINQEGNSGTIADINKVKALGGGIASLGAGLVRSVPYISDLTNRTINTVLNTNFPSDAHNINIPIANQLEGYAKKVDTEIDKEHPKETFDYLKEGEYSKAFDKMGNNIAKILPITLSLMAGNAAGASELALATAATPVFGAQEKQNLKENNPEMTDEQINNVSLISGALEGATEAVFGNVKLGSLYKDIIAKKGVEEANKVVGEGVKKVLLKGLGKYAGNMTEEAASEGANQYLDNLNHIYIGGDKNVKPFDGVMESVLTAIGSAGALGAPIIPHTALQAARTRKQAKEAQKHTDNQNALKETINNPLTEPETKEAAQEALSTSFKEEDKLKEQIQKEHADLPDNKKSEVNNHLESEHKALSASQDQNLTEEQRDAFKSDAEFHAKAVEDIYKENEKLIAEKEKEKEKEVQSFEKQGLSTEEHNPEDYKKDNDDILNSAKEEVKTIKKQEEDAIKEREVEQSSKLEHQNRNESGQTAEASNSNSDEQSREKQQQEEITPIVAEKKKSEYIHKDELLDEEELSPEINPEKQLTDKLDLDLEVFKKVEPKNITKKYTAVNARIDKMVADKQLGKRTANAYKKAFNDMYDQKIKNIKEGITKVGEDIKKELLGNYKGKIFSSALPVTSQMIADLVDLGVKLTHVYIDGKFSTEEAIQKAVSKLKEHPLFKKLSAAKSLNPQAFEKELTDKFINAKEIDKNNRQQTDNPDVHKGTKKRSISSRVLEQDKFKNIASKLKNIDYSVINQKKAAGYANQIIEAYESESALSELADELIMEKSDIPYALQGIVAAKLSDKLNLIAEKEENTFLRDATFDKSAELTMWWAQSATEAGQFNGVAAQEIANSLPLSKEGLRTFANKELEKLHDKILSTEEKETIQNVTKSINELLSSDDLSVQDLAILDKLVSKKIAEISESVNGKEFVIKLNKLDTLLMDLTDC